MNKFFPILLMGCLSMLFAEVFSGASQMWFFYLWGIFLTMPLYLAHILFFLWIALYLKKTTITQLYFFGVIFGLYESWITKVLWTGYMDSAGPGLGTFLGLGIIEFPILVFFWHPIMSFILPILVFEILTNKILVEHEHILTRKRWKTIIIVFFLVFLSFFLCNGNQFNIVSANTSFISSLLLVLVFYYLSKPMDLNVFKFGKKGFIIITFYLFLLYVVTFVLFSPERIPNTIMPYISIIVFYVISILFIAKLNENVSDLMVVNNSLYSINDIIKFTIIMFFAINLACLLPSIKFSIFFSIYLLFSVLGLILFIVVVFGVIKKFLKNGS